MYKLTASFLSAFLVMASPQVSAGTAARIGDLTTHAGTIQQGSANVLIGGTPAARLGDYANCPLFTGLIPHIGGNIATGSSTVLINGLPAARTGDVIPENGSVSNIQIGSPTVIIGN
jgi:uncharacterized Zn-binding protein involved in type VI secretion